MTPSEANYNLSGSDQVRFWAKVDKTDSCWIWTGATLPNGYGVFNLRRKVLYVHRISFFHVHGCISDQLVVDHICRTRNCVNPDHLRELERGENVRIGRSHQREKTLCAQGHPFDAHDGYQRFCRLCRRAANRRYSAKQRDTILEALG